MPARCGGMDDAQYSIIINGSAAISINHKNQCTIVLVLDY